MVGKVFRPRYHPIRCIFADIPYHTNRWCTSTSPGSRCLIVGSRMAEASPTRRERHHPSSRQSATRSLICEFRRPLALQWRLSRLGNLQPCLIQLPPRSAGYNGNQTGAASEVGWVLYRNEPMAVTFSSAPSAVAVENWNSGWCMSEKKNHEGPLRE